MDSNRHKTWKELKEERDNFERREKERLLRKGEEAWKKIKEELQKHDQHN